MTDQRNAASGADDEFGEELAGQQMSDEGPAMLEEVAGMIAGASIAEAFPTVEVLSEGMIMVSRDYLERVLLDLKPIDCDGAGYFNCESCGASRYYSDEPVTHIEIVERCLYLATCELLGVEPELV